MGLVEKCERCGKPVSSRDAVTAKSVREVSVFGGRRDLGGYRVVFHRKCFDPRDPKYVKSLV